MYAIKHTSGRRYVIPRQSTRTYSTNLTDARAYHTLKAAEADLRADEYVVKVSSDNRELSAYNAYA